MTTDNNVHQSDQSDDGPDAISDGIYSGFLVGAGVGIIGFLALGLRGLFPLGVESVLAQVWPSWIVSIAMLTGIAWGVTSIFIGLRRERQTEGGGDQ